MRNIILPKRLQADFTQIFNENVQMGAGATCEILGRREQTVLINFEQKLVKFNRKSLNEMDAACN